MNSATLAGIGMTSQRTRERTVARLREQGIRDERVLAAMGAVPDYGTPEQYSAFIDAEIRKFAGIINKEGLKMDVN